MIIYIGDEQVDLYKHSQVYYSLQRTDIGNLSGRSVSYTNNFIAPWTENNERLFGYAKNENSSSVKPYRLRSCRVVEGVDLTMNAVLYITKSEQKKFSIQIYENIFDYFLSVNDKNISDIVPIEDSGWQPDDIDTARLNTEGIVSALINWGIPIYSSDFFLPSFYYHTLIKSILEFTGFSVSGAILTDTRFTDLIVPYAGDKFEYPESYFSQFSRYAQRNTSQSVTDIVDDIVIVLGFNMTDFTHGTFIGRVAVGGITWNTGTELTIRIYKNAVQVAEEVLANSPAPGGIAEIQYTDFVSPGDVYNLYIYSNAMSSPGIDFTIVGSVTPTTYFRFAPDGVVNRDLVSWNALWPEISCRDLLTDFFTRFGIVPKQIGNTLILKTIEEIILDVPAAVDWSGKLVNTKDKVIDFKTDYAQENIFSYEDIVEDPSLGNGSMLIDNDTLSVSKTIYKSIFGNSNTMQHLGWRLAIIPVYISTATGMADFDEEPGLRLLTLKDRTSENAIIFDVISRTDYKIGYFKDDDLAKDTEFQYFLDEFYPSLTESLQRNKVVRKHYRLNQGDIFSYDPHRMMFDGNGYYLINKISNFTPRRVTKVDNFKVI